MRPLRLPRSSASSALAGNTVRPCLTAGSLKISSRSSGSDISSDVAVALYVERLTASRPRRCWSHYGILRSGSGEDPAYPRGQADRVADTSQSAPPPEDLVDISDVYHDLWFASNHLSADHAH